MKGNNFIIGMSLLVLLLVSMKLQQETFKPMKDVAGFKTKMTEANKKINTLKCNFVQEKNLSFMAEKVISKGNMKYKKPDMMRLDYVTPFQYSMSLYKGKVMIKDNGKVSKFDTKSNKLFKYINDLMINAVQGNVLDNPDFKFTYKESEKNFLIEMDPIQATMKEYVSKVKLTVSRTDYAVTKVEMNESSGDYTIITFTNRVYNTVLADEEFVVK